MVYVNSAAGLYGSPKAVATRLDPAAAGDEPPPYVRGVPGSDRRDQNRKPPEPKAIPVPPGKKWAVDIGACRIHTENFFECVRSRKTPNLDAETGCMVMTAIRLGVDSYREGRQKMFDAKTQKVVDKLPARQVFEGDGKNHEDELKKAAAG